MKSGATTTSRSRGTTTPSETAPSGEPFPQGHYQRVSLKIENGEMSYQQFSDH